MTTTPARPAKVPRVGHYELLAVLGEGGMGVVHLARGPEGQRVALKVLRDHVVGDEEGRARLAREVTTLRRVRSPRVAEVYDADPWGDRPYVVTRYVPGQSLHHRVREHGPLEERDLRFLALGLAEAMVAVHDVGVLHRDIKPSNVLIEGRAPVLIDFGLAKLADDSRLTLTGWLMGTPGYLAPEVLYGDEPVPASDVHAWAATVVYAASGTSPYGGGPGMAVMDRARRGEYDVSALPADLQPLVERCLAPDPAARPGGAELVARMRGLQSPMPTGADPLTQSGTRSGPLTAPLHPVPVAGTRPLTVPMREELPPASYDPGPRPRPASSRSMRTLMLLGLAAVVAAGVGLAPYLAVLATLAVVWVLRAASVNTDAAVARRSLKGPRRTDGFVRAVASPWHLAVASWGTLALVVWAILWSGLVAAVLALFGQEDWLVLLVGGAFFAAGLWWGPGSTRVRNRVRRVVWRAATPTQSGVGWMLGVWLVAVILMIVRIQLDVVWLPASGPPFGELPTWL